MKLLNIHINDSHKGGGGGIVMTRLHNAMKQRGVDSKILCTYVTNESPEVESIPVVKGVERRVRKITSAFGLNDIHRLGSFKVRNHQFYKDADIVHIHSIHGALSYLAIPHLTKRKPVVFTLHDMWAMTGHCAASFDCTRWEIGCGKCPYPNNHPAVKKDNTRIEWNMKKWIFSQSNLTLISPSTSITKQIEQSILKHFPVYQIPHGVDHKIYQPLDRFKARRKLNLPKEKKIILFGAQQLKSHGKGGDLLLSALKQLPNDIKENLILMTFGKHEGGRDGEIVGIPITNLGYLQEDEDKITAYSAANILVSPTRAESFGLIILESLASGTPVVTFRVGGVVDLVIHDVTGYLAEPETPSDLCAGIVHLLKNDILCEKMGLNGREHALCKFTLEEQVQQHLNLYHKLIPTQESVSN